MRGDEYPIHGRVVKRDKGKFIYCKISEDVY